MAGLALCVFFQAGHAGEVAKIGDPGAFLDQTEALRVKDHRQFTQRLEQIHQAAPPLTPQEQWHLRYLDAFELSLDGDFIGAEKPLRDVMEQSPDSNLSAKAGAVLLTNLAASRRYSAAFELAHNLTLQLPEIQDRAARFQVLGNLSQMLNLAGQTDLAIKYAHMMEDTVPPGMTSCYPKSMLLAARYNAKHLMSSDRAIGEALQVCEAAHQPIVANTIELTLSSLYLDENEPAKALAVLQRIAAGIARDNYYPHSLSAQVQRAQAYEKLNRNDDAVKTALAAVSMARPGQISGYLRDAYEVLYKIAKRRGNATQALSYYEHYVWQNKGTVDDAAAQALAYQTIQQQVLTRQLQGEELSRQNSILKLQQALDAKAAQTSRLYIFVLLIALASIAFLLVRIKRSQLRFKKLASHDGLTGILNHQHFMNEAERLLSVAQSRQTDVSLISIDLDHFKRVNDTHGHATGDEVLKRAVEVCKTQLRANDIFGRLGGEEFGILLPGCPREKATLIANCIRLAIGDTAVAVAEQTIWISASVGLACTSSSGFTLKNLCTDADAALYCAKRSGRNRVVADACKDASKQAD